MIIVIEGFDQAGKKTQSRLLVGFLKKKKIKSKIFSFPDYSTPIGKEIKLAFNRFVKSVDAAIAVVPEIKKFLEENRRMKENPPKSQNTFLAGSILSAALFVGSSILYTVNNFVGEIGIASSVVVIGISIALKDR